MRPFLLNAAVLVVGVAFLWRFVLPAQLRPPIFKPRVLSKELNVKTELATFGAGCFWGVEADFRALPGVTNTQVGYEGGAKKNPTYEDVCTDETGHAEVVQVEFEPAKVSYDQLLDLFWASHDPTTKDRQGPDVGSQYRSAIFFHSPEQEAVAKASKEKADRSEKFRRPIVTEIVPAAHFYAAEDYHQQYLEKRGMRSCHVR